MLGHLVRKFSRFGLLIDAESILLTLLEHRQSLPELPTMLYVFANACTRYSQFDKAHEYIGLIRHRYPESEEAANAKILLEHMGNPPLKSEAS